MEIKKEIRGNSLLLRVSGRLDARWADALDSDLSETVRSGARHILLNMKDVVYMSSAGIRVLIIYHKKLNALDGSFAVIKPSEAVHSVLSLSGLEMLLKAETDAPKGDEAVLENFIRRETASLVLNLYEPHPEKHPKRQMSCRVIGNPTQMAASRGYNAYNASDARPLTITPDLTALGIGAFGNDFKDCQERFGEFLAVGDAACYLPADGSGVPDFLVSSQSFLPEVQVLYSLECRGPFSSFLQFEPKQEGQLTRLSELVAAAFDQLPEADTLAMVIAADTGGLIGASLKQSPAGRDHDTSPFEFPEIRKQLSFISERAFNRNLSLVAGVVSMGKNQTLAPFLRPLTDAPYPAGHFHAAVFSYHTLAKGILDLNETVTDIFEKEKLLGVLHLLNDTRPISGAGESMFIRGAVWFSPITINT